MFASAHLGPWERVAASLAMAGVPLTVVAREPYDPRLGRIYDRVRASRGVRTVYRGATGAGIALVRVLKRGGVLGVPMDLASRVASIEVPFLGVPAQTPVGPARLALLTGAVVVVGTAAKAPDGSLALSFTRLDAPASSEEDADRPHQRGAVRAHPGDAGGLALDAPALGTIVGNIAEPATSGYAAWRWPRRSRASPPASTFANSSWTRWTGSS